MKLAGIIYLQEISQSRIEPGKGNLQMFNTLCLPPAFRNVILATTKWRTTPADVGQRREQQMSKEYWTGSNVARFDNTFQSAWSMINRILEKDTVDTSLIHEDLVK